MASRGAKASKSKVTRKTSAKRSSSRTTRSTTRRKKSTVKKHKRTRLTALQRDRIIVEHREVGLKLAYSMLKKWRISMNKDDVSSAVGAALVEAGNRFDPSRGVAFKTFFFYHLRGILLKEISTMIDEQKNIQQIPGGILTDASVGEQYLQNKWSMPLVEHQSPERLIAQRQLSSIIWRACAALDPLEQEVLIRSFVNEESLIDIAKDLDYCRCHISRVKSAALEKLGRRLDRALSGDDSAVAEPLCETEAPVEELDDLPKETKKRRRSRKTKRVVNYSGGRGRRKVEATFEQAEALSRYIANSVY